MNILIFRTQGDIVLVEGVTRLWQQAHARNDTRTWRALGVYLFTCGASLEGADVPQRVEADHDTLAMVAMQHAHDLQPVRHEDVFARPSTSEILQPQPKEQFVRVYQLIYLTHAAVLEAEMQGDKPKPATEWFPSEREAVVRRIALVNGGKLVGKKTAHEIWPVDIPTNKQDLLSWLNKECV